MVNPSEQNGQHTAVSASQVDVKMKGEHSADGYELGTVMGLIRRGLTGRTKGKRTRGRRIRGEG
jgi:hypothetical protein